MIWNTILNKSQWVLWSSLCRAEHLVRYLPEENPLLVRFKSQLWIEQKQLWSARKTQVRQWLQQWQTRNCLNNGRLSKNKGKRAFEELVNQKHLLAVAWRKSYRRCFSMVIKMWRVWVSGCMHSCVCVSIPKLCNGIKRYQITVHCIKRYKKTCDEDVLNRV